MFSKKRKIKPKAIINVNVETEWIDIDFPNKFHVMQTAISSNQNPVFTNKPLDIDKYH